MGTSTNRLLLPLLIAGQSQKEVTHNNAFALADMLIQAVVQSVAPSSVPTAPVFGQCWIVGIAATGAWAGQDGALACWTSGGWLFSAPFEAMQVWSIADSATARRSYGVWVIGVASVAAIKINNLQVLGMQQPAIIAPTGGTNIDAQARATLGTILIALRTHGLIAT